MADNLSITKVLDPRLRTDIDREYIAVIGADNWVKYRFGASALSNTQMALNNIKPAGERFMITLGGTLSAQFVSSSQQTTLAQQSSL